MEQPATNLVAVSTGTQHNLKAISDGFRTIMIHLGLDPDDESVVETPMRVARMLSSFNQPFDAGALLKVFDTASDTGGIVAQSGIPFQMLCEHHFLPAIGKAHIAYLPGSGKVVGLSKLSRLVRAVGCERPSLQEAITERIANLLREHLNAQGVMVIVDAEHTCMTCRGAHAPGVCTTTSVVKGIFRDVPHARQEAMQLLINRK
jgi:GTP cyclohydrolase I